MGGYRFQGTCVEVRSVERIAFNALSFHHVGVRMSSAYHVGSGHLYLLSTLIGPSCGF